MVHARNGMPAMARTPVLPEAIPLGALSALQRRSQLQGARSAGLEHLEILSAPAEWPELYRFLDAGSDETVRTLSEPASKKRRGTKSRGVWGRVGSRAMGI